MKQFFLILFCFVSVFHLKSQINFTSVEKKIPNASTQFSCVAIGDVTNDKLQDVVIGTSYYFDEIYDYSVLVFKQNSKGELGTFTQLKYPDSYPGLTSIDISDLNNDGLNDIVIGYAQSIGIYYQLATGGYSTINIYYSGQNVNAIETVDFNKDGLTDIVVAHSSDKFINIFYQTKNGGFTTTKINLENGCNNQICVGDMNGDNLNDIIITPGYPNAATVQVLYQNESNGFTLPGYVYKNQDEGYTDDFASFAIGDLNNDNRIDIVGTLGGNSPNASLMLMYQNSLGTMGEKNVKVQAYDIPVPVKIKDLNCDGQNEIIVGHTGWESITVYEKGSSYEFGYFTKYPANYYFEPNSMDVGDINNDGKPDIVSVGQDATINILYNISKPVHFDNEEIKIYNLLIEKDTTTTTQIFYTPIVDTAPSCKSNKRLKNEILIKNANERYSGDSLIIRKTMLCNSLYSDTIVKLFNYVTTKEIDRDTTSTVVNDNYINAYPSDLFIDAKNELKGWILIESNICWTISGDKNWLTINQTDGNGDTYIEYEATENISTTARTATISIHGKETPDLKIGVRQYGAEPFLELSATTFFLDEEVNNKAILAIKSNIKWSTSTSDDWFKPSKNEGIGSDTIYITAKPNQSNTDRQGTLSIITDEWGELSVDIYQFANTLQSQQQVNITPYPSPAVDHVYFKTNNNVKINKVEVFDTNGLKCQDNLLDENSDGINISQLKAGVYYIKVHTSAKTEVHKIVKK